MIKRKSNTIFILLTILFHSCSSIEYNTFKIRSIKTTFIEVGTIENIFDASDIEKEYKHSKIIVSKKSRIIILKKYGKVLDTISLLSCKNSLNEVLTDQLLYIYPTDNFHTCFESKGIDCDVSKKLIELMEISDYKKVKIQIGKSLFSSNNYIIFYEKNYIHLVCENEMTILTFK